MAKRIHRRRKNGLFNPDAPYWCGQRAERIVKDRITGYRKRKPRKKRQ